MKLFVFTLVLAFALGYYMEYLSEVWRIALTISIGGANMYAHGLMMKRYVDWMDRRALQEKRNGSKPSTPHNP